MAGLSYKNQPYPNYLANNPIVFELKSTIQEQIKFDVTISGSVVYSGTFIPSGLEQNYEANISISEILKSYLQESEILDTTLLVNKVTNSFLYVSVKFTQNTSVLNYSGKIYKGGIGKKMLRYLKSKNTDIFAYKLHNTDKQFFLTTRTSGRHIVIKENELYPLYFIAAGKAYTAVTDFGGVFIFPAMTSGNLYAINIDMLRKISYDTYKKIPAFIGILINGKYVFDITIKEPVKTPNKYIIEFLNSFSVPERLEVTGKCVSEPEFDNNEGFATYDNIVDDYIEQNDRIGLREIINAEFGYKTIDEYLFMRDMLQSNKRYLIDPEGNKHEVIVSSDKFSHDIYPTEPGSIPLKIRFIDNDSNYSPAIDESDPDFNFGEAIWLFGVTNAYGFLFADSTLNTI